MAIDLDVWLTALRANPVAREAIQRELLTEDLLGLPSRMDQLTAQVEKLATAQLRTEERLGQLAARMDQLAARMDQLATRMDQLAARMDQLAAAQAKTEERLGQLVTVQGQMQVMLKPLVGYVAALRGTVYERAAVRPRMVAGAIGASTRMIHPVPPEEVAGRLEAAVTAGVLTDQQADAIEVTNGVFVWDQGPGTAPVYCVVEASITPGLDDVARAAARAGWLAKTGVEARAVVLSHGVPSAEVATAMTAQRVAWRRVEHPRGPLHL